MKKFNVAFATGSRADYGIVRRYLKLLDKDERVSLSILVTGALLDEKYGHQVDLIYGDGFHIGAEVKVSLDSSSNAAILHTMAEVLDKFGRFFSEYPPDLLIILGDRYEMLSIAIAAAMQRIPILHIHGGEATYGNYDEFIRHAITKMSYFHFTATEKYRQRVIQLGEDPERVFNLGSLGAENCLYIDTKNVPEEIKKMDTRKYFVILFHPETLTGISPGKQVHELLCALEGFPDYKSVFLGSNADTHSDDIRDEIRKFVDKNANTVYYENLHPDAYHFLVKNSAGLIGNSSSGIIEAPSLGVYTINIGDRQKGRVRGNSVIDTACRSDEIRKSIRDILKLPSKVDEIDNPYYQAMAYKRYYKETLDILAVAKDNCGVKSFFDIL